VFGFCEHGNETWRSMKGEQFYLVAELLLASKEWLWSMQFVCFLD
jgi:hypothetical protein